MKLKSVLVVALLAAFSTVGFSQIRYGAKLGLNISSFNADGYDFSSRIAPLFGGFAEYSINDQWAIQPELVLSMEGANFDMMGTETTLKNTYLNIPILAKYKLSNGISFEAGPQIGFLMGAKADDEDNKDSFNSTNISLAFGGAYELESGLGFDLRYNIGMSNIADSGDDVTASALQISAFYKF